MGVFTVRHLAWGLLILLSLVLNKVTDAQQTSESLKNATTAPPLNVTGNQTANNALNSSSNSLYSENTTAQNSLTTQVTPVVTTNSTSGTTLNNSTVTASTEQPNTTENTRTTQLFTSSTTTTSSTSVTSTNSTQSSTEKATSSSTEPVTKTTAITYTVQNSTHSNIDSQGLNRSEQSLTIFFSVLLGLIVLVTLVHFVYKCSRSKERSVQYTHRRLQNDDTGEPFGVADDTMVISGGLYDGPQIYNPTMTVQNEEEFQTDAYGFASRPTQFRLEFLREDQDRELDHETSTFQTFQAQEP